jgi:hypothetical protein
MNISCERTGDHYVSEVWYFDNWDEFRLQREHLFSYLTQHGTVSSVTLDLSEELARTNNTYLAGLKTRQVRAIKYENTTTSGYFLIFYTDIFPGPSYYIAYYGVVGSSGIQEHTPQLETLIMTTFPGLMEYQTYEINPESPMTRSTPLPVIIIILALGIVGLIRELQRRR